MESYSTEELLEYLCQGILTLQTPEECKSFLEDLCTPSELQEMSRRLLAAKMLRNNRIYADIATETGLSTATISRVNRCIKYGSDGGYVTVLERLERKAHR
jgi:TrpR-related protein YerC/YecD